MKGIILAGGSATRLYPSSLGASKQLFPVYDKPMVYYPLSTLMLAGIKDILIITNERDLFYFKQLLGDGHQFGINFEYIIQDKPEGLAQAFTLGANFINGESCAMILGDNIFYGNDFVKMLNNARLETINGKATIFGYQVKDPERFGIMEIDDNHNVLSVEEKPENPKSDFAITGLYFYDNTVVEKAFNIKKSARGEYEITDLNRMYLEEENLRAELLGGGFAWFDTGLNDSLLNASNAIKTLQDVSGKIISCPEQIAYNQGWLDDNQLEKQADLMKKTEYGNYLKKTLRKGR